jgi:hypothetical protein
MEKLDFANDAPDLKEVIRELSNYRVERGTQEFSGPLKRRWPQISNWRTERDD